VTSRAPDWERRGVNPTWAPSERLRPKRRGSSTVAMKVGAVTAPTPGTEVSRRQTGEPRTISPTVRSSAAIWAATASRAASSADTVV